LPATEAREVPTFFPPSAFLYPLPVFLTGGCLERAIGSLDNNFDRTGSGFMLIREWLNLNFSGSHYKKN
jgi:hypothetical protein